MKKKKRKNRFFFILILIEASILLFWGAKSYLLVMRTAENIKRVEKEFQELKLENEKLKKDKENLKNPFYMEKMAREKLGLAKKGEIIYKILPSSPKKE